MKEDIKKYYSGLKSLLDKVEASGKNSEVFQFDEAVYMAINKVLDCNSSSGKLMFVGNGASAAISSHISVDFWKTCGVRAVAFNDSSLLTCISNDCGYRHVFEKPIEMFADSKDILFAISSSGKSENILRAVQMARSKGCFIITLSGFKIDNSLRSFGDINFYVPYESYGYVEVIHHCICHSMIDIISDRGHSFS